MRAAGGRPGSAAISSGAAASTWRSRFGEFCSFTANPADDQEYWRVAHRCRGVARLGACRLALGAQNPSTSSRSQFDRQPFTASRRSEPGAVGMNGRAIYARFGVILARGSKAIDAAPTSYGGAANVRGAKRQAPQQQESVDEQTSSAFHDHGHHVMPAPPVISTRADRRAGTGHRARPGSRGSTAPPKSILCRGGVAPTNETGRFRT